MRNQGFQGGCGMNMLKRVTDFFRDEEGASVVEYAVLIALIIAACISVIFILGGKVEKAYNDFAKSL
jgi:pilus assembly protein Flp/PilA